MELEDPIFNTLATYTRALSVALSYRDLSTQLHSVRVQGLSGVIGIAIGLSKQQLNSLNIAAAFHDIGKIGIPDHILLKPAEFDNAEREEMKHHSEIGEKIMAATELDGSKLAAQIIRHHHEHYDGHGYPDGLSGENIPICARIIAIADSYDAMSVTRSYHQARTHQEVMNILQEETGEIFDPALMHVFSEIIESNEYKTLRA
jgi:HD-GYP domain-containing protein (c-di-GMP phosphodiesterase class II)